MNGEYLKAFSCFGEKIDKKFQDEQQIKKKNIKMPKQSFKLYKTK